MMKFGKTYKRYVQGLEKKLPMVGYGKLKKVLKKCKTAAYQTQSAERDGTSSVQDVKEEIQSYPHDRCPDCDVIIFSALLNEMLSVVHYFNERAKQLLEMHLSSGFWKLLMCFVNKQRIDHVGLLQEVKDIIIYAMMNATATRKISKKFDKILFSKQGQTFRAQAQSKKIEILQSPLMHQLIAFYINERETNAAKMIQPAELYEGFSLVLEDGKPLVSCSLFESIKLNIDLSCSICLDTVFDPVSLTCGHIFCYMCACSAASVTIVDGLKTADHKKKCPLCRQEGVYEGAVHLDQLSILLNRSCREYWEERRQTERVERVRLVKQYWEVQLRLMMGV